MAVSASLLLVACAGPVVRSGSDAPSAARPVVNALATAPAQKSGGYYLDDGPSEETPDLAGIPDAEPIPEPLNPRANKPYTALGQEFVPEQEVRPSTQKGVASWYGKRFHGRKTANGEKYDMHKMTAAHPTLPIPSYARVTNVANGRSVVVRVNDRGPFIAGRVIDLSFAAARKLDYAHLGHTQVEIETIVPDGPQPQILAAADPEPRARSRQGPLRAQRQPAADGDVPVREAGSALAPQQVVLTAAAVATPLATEPVPADVLKSLNSQAAGKEVFVQVGAFSTNDRAEGLRARLSLDFSWLSDALKVLRAADGMFRLHAGPFRTMEEAFRVAERLRGAAEYKPIIVMR